MFAFSREDVPNVLLIHASLGIAQLLVFDDVAPEFVAFEGIFDVDVQWEAIVRLQEDPW
jgi:hypothetical protein